MLQCISCGNPVYPSSQAIVILNGFFKFFFRQSKWPLAFELLNNCGGAQREGYIGFQDHGDDVWFRNIRIKVLD